MLLLFQRQHLKAEVVVVEAVVAAEEVEVLETVELRQNSYSYFIFFLCKITHM